MAKIGQLPQEIREIAIIRVLSWYKERGRNSPEDVYNVSLSLAFPWFQTPEGGTYWSRWNEEYKDREYIVAPETMYTIF